MITPLFMQERFKVLADELNSKNYEVDTKYELMGLLRDISGLPVSSFRLKHFRPNTEAFLAKFGRFWVRISIIIASKMG